MPGEAHLIVAAGLALAATFVATPWAIGVATRTGFQDHPLGYKRHLSPTPYLGGAAVLLGFLLATLTIGDDLRRLGPIVAGAGALWALGTLDDRLSLGPALRLAIEAGVAMFRPRSLEAVDNEVQAQHSKPQAALLRRGSATQRKGRSLR